MWQQEKALTMMFNSGRSAWMLLRALMAALVALILPATVQSQEGAASSTEIRVELNESVGDGPDYVCIVSEIGRSDAVGQPPGGTSAAKPVAAGHRTPLARTTPAKAQLEGAGDPCLAPIDSNQATVPLKCLASPESDPERSQWTFIDQDLERLADVFSNRKDLAAAVHAMSQRPTHIGCSSMVDACAARFVIPTSIDQEFYSRTAVSSPQPAQILCSPQRARPLAQAPKVAVIYLEIAGPTKKAVNLAKLVGNVATLTLDGQLAGPASVSIGVIGGHYAVTRRAFVIDGHIALALEPACSRHEAPLSRLVRGNTKFEVHVNGVHRCDANTEAGRVDVWLERTEEREGGRLTLRESRSSPSEAHSANKSSSTSIVQEFAARWAELRPGQELHPLLGVVSFDWQPGCFTSSGICPEVMLDDMLVCRKRLLNEGKCQYTCDATSQSASIALPARLTFGLPSQDPDLDGGDTKQPIPIRFRWHQVLPAAGASLYEDISEPEGRSLLLRFPWTYHSSSWFGLAVNRVVLRSATSSIAIDPRKFRGRIAAPGFACGDSIQVEYQGDRHLDISTLALSPDLPVVPDPQLRLPKLGIRLSLAGTESLVQDGNTVQTTYALRLRGLTDLVLSSFGDMQLFALLGTTVGYGTDDITIVEDGVRRDEGALATLISFDAGVGLDMGRAYFQLSASGGMTGIRYSNWNAAETDLVLPTWLTGIEYGIRLSRHWSVATTAGINWQNPRRIIDIATRSVTSEQRAFQLFAGLGVSAHFLR
jgi:hypothetical protein